MDFRWFVETVHQRLPGTEVLFIALSPRPAPGEKDKNRESNRLYPAHGPGIAEVGSWMPMTSASPRTARPRRELFVKDRPHFGPEGYKLLAERVRPFLAQ